MVVIAGIATMRCSSLFYLDSWRILGFDCGSRLVLNSRRKSCIGWSKFRIGSLRGKSRPYGVRLVGTLGIQDDATVLPTSQTPTPLHKQSIPFCTTLICIPPRHIN